MKKSQWFTYIFAVPYILAFAGLSYSFMPKQPIEEFSYFFQGFMNGVLVFLPFMYIINKNSKQTIFDFKNRNAISKIALSMLIFMMFAIISFYLLVIGKLLMTNTFIDFLGYSLMPPILCLYILPYMMYRYSINREGFYKELHRTLNNF